LPDTTTRTRDKYLRSALTGILSDLYVTALDSAQVRMGFGDSAFVTHHFAAWQVSFAHAEEFIVTLVWDTKANEFVEVAGCC